MSGCRFAACWTHAGRKIDECQGAFPAQTASLRSGALTSFGGLITGGKQA